MHLSQYAECFNRGYGYIGYRWNQFVTKANATKNYNQFIHRMAQNCYNNKDKQIMSPKSIKYRHKMTYDFSYIQNHGLSQLGIDQVNDLCFIIYNFAKENQNLLPFQFWNEMMVQYSRTNKFLIKLIINPFITDLDIENIFKQIIIPKFRKRLMEKHSENFGNKIDTIVYQKCPSSKSKPSKYDKYYILHGNGKISHSTPIHDIDIKLSCNAFCEPNLIMEHKQLNVSING